MRPQTILRAAGAAIAPVRAPRRRRHRIRRRTASPHSPRPSRPPRVLPASATTAAARPAAGDVAIARRRLNVVSGRRALVSGARQRRAPCRPGASPCSAARAAAGTRSTATAPGRAARSRFDFRPRDAGSARCASAPAPRREHVGRLNVFRRAVASWYGPGLYGGRLGCGGHADAGHPRRREQDAALRHEGDAAPRRAHRARARRRPRPLRRRPRVRPHRRDEGPARASGRRASVLVAD